MVAEEKAWYLSRGIWGSLLSGLVSILVFVEAVWPGVIPSGTTETLEDPNTLVGIMAAAGFLSSILSWVGRVGAKKPIGGGITGASLPSLLLGGMLFIGVPAGVVGVAVAPGCATIDENQHPTQAAYDTRRAFNGLVRTLLAADDDGLIDGDTWKDIDEVIQEGRLILNDWDDAIDAGDETGAEIAETLLQGVVSRLFLYRTRVEEGGAP